MASFCVLQADPVQLKGFLSVVKMAVQGKSLDQITLTSLAPASANQVTHHNTPQTDGCVLSTYVIHWHVLLVLVIYH